MARGDVVTRGRDRHHDDRETDPLRQTLRFLLHFGEMVLAMMVGMGVFAVVNSAILIPMGICLPVRKCVSAGLCDWRWRFR